MVTIISSGAGQGSSHLLYRMALEAVNNSENSVLLASYEMNAKTISDRIQLILNNKKYKIPRSMHIKCMQEQLHNEFNADSFSKMFSEWMNEYSSIALDGYFINFGTDIYLSSVIFNIKKNILVDAAKRNNKCQIFVSMQSPIAPIGVELRKSSFFLNEIKDDENGFLNYIHVMKDISDKNFHIFDLKAKTHKIESPEDFL